MLYEDRLARTHFLSNSIESEFRINMLSNPKGARVDVGCDWNLLESAELRASHGRDS